MDKYRLQRRINMVMAFACLLLMPMIAMRLTELKNRENGQESAALEQTESQSTALEEEPSLEETADMEPDEAAKERMLREKIIGKSSVCIYVKAPGEDSVYTSGSGVTVFRSGDEIVVATAAHTLEHAADEMQGEIYMVFDLGDTMRKERCVRFERMPDYDLAFLWLERSQAQNEDLFETVIAADTDPQKLDESRQGDTVYVSGFLGGTGIFYEGEMVYSWIYTEDFEQNMTIVRCGMEPGMSGGGVFDKSGSLLGIACGKNGDKMVAAVPVSVVKTFLDRFQST